MPILDPEPTLPRFDALCPYPWLAWFREPVEADLRLEPAQISVIQRFSGRRKIAHRSMLFFRPVGLNELRLIYDSGMRGFPPRLPEQPIFYPVLSQTYAEQIARDWNTKCDPFAGYVTRFSLDNRYASQFEAHKVGGRDHVGFWVPSSKLADFNKHIEFEIAVKTSFFGSEFVGEIPNQGILAGQTSSEQLRSLVKALDYNTMDFLCETAANHRIVFLNFSHWLCCPLDELGVSDAQRGTVNEAIRRPWNERCERLSLPEHGEQVS